MKLKKGDKIKVTVGKDRGKDGVVEKIWPKDNKVTITGINLFKRHQKPKGEGQKGGIVEFARPLLVSKVALVCQKCKQVTRIGYKEKIRICRKCDQEI